MDSAEHQKHLAEEFGVEHDQSGSQSWLHRCHRLGPNEAILLVKMHKVALGNSLFIFQAERYVCVGVKVSEVFEMYFLKAKHIRAYLTSSVVSPDLEELGRVQFTSFGLPEANADFISVPHKDVAHLGQIDSNLEASHHGSVVIYVELLQPERLSFSQELTDRSHCTH